MDDKTIAVDFDGVIHDWRNPVPGKRMGMPYEGADESMDELESRGHKLVIYTVQAIDQAGKERIEAWLDHYGISYHEVTAIKPNAIIYIDDRAIRHLSWIDTMMQVDLLTGYIDENE